MSLNSTPSGERIHIGFFGRRNAGKSSLVNAVLQQDLAIVSDTKGTTTDPVYKSMELLPLGPVLIIDTPGIDDEGDLGELRVKASYRALNKTDIAIIVLDGYEFREEDKKLLKRIKEKQIPYIIAYNKCDLYQNDSVLSEHEISVSAKEGIGILELRERIGQIYKMDEEERHIVSDIISPGDVALLVIPIDKAAPKGRLILPQQQTIRDILDHGSIPVMCRDSELADILSRLNFAPALVITDSQVFAKVSEILPKEIPLTSFSILMARYKGFLSQAVKGVEALNEMKDGDRILISEGCTHHRQCGDIGSEKIPKWISAYTNKNLSFEFSSGTEFPEDLSAYKLVVHCGACMLNAKEMRYRLRLAMEQKVPMTNYGTLIAEIHGILRRSISPIPIK